MKTEHPLPRTDKQLLQSVSLLRILLNPNLSEPLARQFLLQSRLGFRDIALGHIDSGPGKADTRHQNQSELSQLDRQRRICARRSAYSSAGSRSVLMSTSQRSLSVRSPPNAVKSPTILRTKLEGTAKE